MTTQPRRPHTELAERLAELFNDISLRMRPTVLDSWSEIALTMHEFRALSILLQGRLRVTDLAQLLGIRLSSATNLVDRLELKGLLQREHDLHDRRVVWCGLTPLGQKEADNLWRIR